MYRDESGLGRAVHAVASVFGHYGDVGGEGPLMRLWQTTEEDVKVRHDLFVPAPKVGTKGVRLCCLVKRVGIAFRDHIPMHFKWTSTNV